MDDLQRQSWIGFSYYAYIPGEVEAEDRDGSLRRKMFVRAWELIPEDLKPHSRLIPFFVGPPEGFLSFGADQLSRNAVRQEILELSDAHAIPIHPYVRMAYDRNSREWHEGAEVPLDELETMFQRHKYLRGVHIGELAGEAGFFAEERQYLMDAIRLAAKYGRVVSLWDHANLWQILLLDEEFIDLIRQYPDTFLPFWETNGAKCEYADQGMPFGLWASGLVNRWGVNPQAGWYWFEAGYRKVWQGKFMSGAESAAPDVLWGLMATLGATAGAGAYFFEGTEGWFWNYRGKFGESDEAGWDPDIGKLKKTRLPQKWDLSDTFKNVVAPTLRLILQKDAIPSRQQVLEKTKLVYQTRWLPDDVTPVFNPEMFRRMSWAGGLYDNLDTLPAFWSMPVPQKHFYMGHLYPATYGITDGSDLIPKTSRFGWIPIFSKYAGLDALPPGKTVIGSGDFKTREAMEEFLAAKAFTAEGEGTAWMTQVGSAVYVINRHENEPKDDAYCVTMGPVGLSGVMPPLTFMVARRHKGGVSIDVNNFIKDMPQRKMTIHIDMARRDFTAHVRSNQTEKTAVFDSVGGAAEICLCFNGFAHVDVLFED